MLNHTTMSFQRCILIIFLVISSFSAFTENHVIADALIVPSLKQQRIRCYDHEKAALLRFKQSFLIDCDASTPPFAYPKTKSWQQHAFVANGSKFAGDCCTWEGVECDKDTNFVIGLDLSSSCLSGMFLSNNTVFSLNHLIELNLADNNFNRSSIPSSIGRLYKLRSLNLSESHFSGMLPSEMSLLSSLTILDLSDNGDPTSNTLGSLVFGHRSLDKFVKNMTRLTQLNLNYVDISSSKALHLLANVNSLTLISLSSCQLYGKLPRRIFQLPHLEVLRLFDNPRLIGQLPEFHPNSPLTNLDLRVTGLSGELPSSIGNLGRLKQLSIDMCFFFGNIPSSLGNLTKLTTLSFESNDFSGTMPSSLTNLTNLRALSLTRLDVRPLILNSWLLKLNKLTYLSLTKMNMGNKIPSNLANLTSLTLLYLEQNHLSGAVPQWFANLTQLSALRLAGNKLEGPVQSWLSMLVNLQVLDLSDIKFHGIFEQFLELPNIKELYLSNLNLTFVPNLIANDSSIPKLTILDLISCNLTEFPQSLRHQNELQALYLARNNIGGHIPQWFMDITKKSLIYLDLFSNSLVGFERPFVFLPWPNLEVLRLSCNKLRGTLPIPSNTMQAYEISNNNLYGTIPKTICLASSLAILDLSNNSMSGFIPHCVSHQLGNSLQVLNLRGNNFHGTIPQRFDKSCSLRMINLSDNQFEGQLPRSLANCTMLEVLDLGKNRVNDTFPFWLGSLSSLQVLVLRHNSFYGKIKNNSNSRQAFGRLRIIDLSHNFHVGTLPSSYLLFWLGIQVPSEDQSGSYDTVIRIPFQQSGPGVFNFVAYTINYVITITNKGSDTLYPEVLTVFRVVDFSSNNFTGEIPSFLGDLRGLQALNLSNNNLEGIIPSSLSNINDLESLDLSHNLLSGVIPQELSMLKFLEIFNVSHNRLVGSIPRGSQFDTFDNSSFGGNLGLCGEPLSKKCGVVPPVPGLPSQKDTDDASGDDSNMIGWVIRALGCASGFIVGFVIGKLYITDKYHVWFIRTFAMKRKKKSRGRNASNQRRNR